MGRFFSSKAVGKASTISSSAVRAAPFGHGKISPGGWDAMISWPHDALGFRLNQPSMDAPSRRNDSGNGAAATAP
jgi:hypothetical protein